MAIPFYITSTPRTRNRTVDSQVKSNPRNNLIYGQGRKKGHNSRGIITARHRGGGHKRLYRQIDFRRTEKDIYGRIVTMGERRELNPRVVNSQSIALTTWLHPPLNFFFFLILIFNKLNKI
jgi:ribosomal protein L2|uniref:Ribosomal protein L2 n=1 Tax=Drosera rotundifolia TaxID=173423 RepID=A0A140E9S4_DRORT|nr:ribosomal protein L2 [Drosera rotundifolia]AMK97287.1 ribosomal protein L2 [Drosera rotundifolia]